MKKINYGCGYDYKEGFINIDANPESPADMIISYLQSRLDFEDNSVDYIYSQYCLEHLSKPHTEALIREFHRILKPNGKLELILPHFTGLALKHLDHKHCFGIGTFDGFNIDNPDPSTKSNPKFKILKQTLHLLPIRETQINLPKIMLSLAKLLDKFFNLGNSTIKQIHEKYLWGGFENIHYIMEKR